MKHKPTPKLLFYSDCFIFGGSELVLVNLMHSPAIHDTYSVSYAYCRYPAYHTEAQRRCGQLAVTYPLRLFSHDAMLYQLTTQSHHWWQSWLANALSTIRYTGCYDIWNFVRLYTLFKKLQPDILHINNGGYPGAITCRVAAISALCAGVPRIVFTVNNIARPQSNVLHAVLDRMVDRAVTVFTTASHAARNALAMRRGFDLQRIIAIPNTLAVNAVFPTTQGQLRGEFKINSNTIVVCSAGLLTYRKGYDVLIEAVRERQHDLRTKNVVFFAFGDGEQRWAITKLVESYHLQDIICFPGYRNDLVEYLADADIFVMPSRTDEDMPLVILYAMRLSKPIVATKVGGIPEQVTHGINGLLVEPNDPKSLSNALLELVYDEDARQRYGTAGNKKYKLQFNKTIAMNMFASMYHSLMTKSPHDFH